MRDKKTAARRVFTAKNMQLFAAIYAKMKPTLHSRIIVESLFVFDAGPVSV